MNFNDRCLFFPLQYFSYRVDSKRLKHILYFDKTNQNNKYANFTFLDKLAYILLLFFLSATLIMLTTKCKTNLILDKTNKINSLQ